VVRHRLDLVGMGLEFTHLHPEAKRLIEGTANRKVPLEQITHVPI
jgi:hypothetical protein